MDWDAIYTTRILPDLGVRRGGIPSPRLVFVCGQPGAGKSTTISRLLAQLGPDQTQLISADRMADHLPEIFADDADPAAKPLAEVFDTHAHKAYVDALFDHAASLRAHVIWERPFPGLALSLGLAARAYGYRTECVVLAVPPDESWLSVLTRETSPADRSGVPARVRWDRLLESCNRWPAFLARAEDQHAFDEIRVVNRDGEVLFENRLVPNAVPPRWENIPFAFESLMVERLHPRNSGQIDALLATWQTLRSHPDLAFRNHSEWPWADIASLGKRLQALRDDPATGFDLNDPAANPDPRASLGWIARLQSDLTAALASPEGDGLKTLAPRADRLLALVRNLSGQPS
jgi:hypothetical protein